MTTRLAGTMSIFLQISAGKSFIEFISALGASAVHPFQRSASANRWRRICRSACLRVFSCRGCPACTHDYNTFALPHTKSIPTVRAAHACCARNSLAVHAPAACAITHSMVRGRSRERREGANVPHFHTFFFVHVTPAPVLQGVAFQGSEWRRKQGREEREGGHAGLQGRIECLRGCMPTGAQGSQGFR